MLSCKSKRLFVGSEALVEPCKLLRVEVLWKSSCVETINGTTFPLTCHGTVKDHIGVLWNAARKSPCLTRCQVLLDTLAAQRHIAVNVRSVRDVWWIIFLHTTAQQLGDSNRIPTVGPAPHTCLRIPVGTPSVWGFPSVCWAGRNGRYRPTGKELLFDVVQTFQHHGARDIHLICIR